VHQVGHHDRCGTIIEPYLSHQWFLKMNELAAAATKSVENGDVTLFPERWQGVFHNWMRNIRDWCISRQLWWGHRIPVWTCGSCHEQTCEVETPDVCAHCGSSELVQDNDVLDTWFSSWLWTFSPLGWPDKTSDLEKYHPTSILVTGPDIIFFWVARMMMASYHFLDERPFAEVLFHGIVRDGDGRKMSKSLGNSPDPIKLMDDYGADALRCSMLMLTPTGQDIFFSEETFEVGRNFSNKIFQATKLVLNGWDESGLKVEQPAADFKPDCDLGRVLATADKAPGEAVSALWTATFGSQAPVAIKDDDIALEDRWLLNRLCATTNEVNGALEKRRLNDAAYAAYNFFRHEYCDWYLEAIKPRLRDEAQRGTALCLAQLVLAHSYKLLHPVMPFITEELWSWLPAAGGFLMTSRFPVCSTALPFAGEAERFQQDMDVITMIRSLRADLNVPPGKRGHVVLRNPDARVSAQLDGDKDLMALLAKLEVVEVVNGGEDPSPAGTGVAGTTEVFLLMAGLVDLDKERDRLTKELAKVEGFIKGSRAKLSNENFTSRAPEDVIAKQREMLAENEAQAETLRNRLTALDKS
jgi:valyl-tRNA synthetase